MEPVHIRLADKSDAPALRELYAYYVENTAITFEGTPPTLTEFEARMDKVLGRYPYLIAESGGALAGYVCAGVFNPRSAYDWDVETTIYVSPDLRRRGVGRTLYTALEKGLALQKILNLNACIGWPETEDEYLTKNSAQFHERMGYRLVGRFSQCGYKFDRWYDMIWMEKHLGPHTVPPAPVLPFEAVREQFLRELT